MSLDADTRAALADEADAADRVRVALEELADAVAAHPTVLRHGGDVPGDGLHRRLDLLLRERLGDDLTAHDPRPVERPRRRSIGTRKALRVFARDGYRCRACGSPDDLTVDHILAWSRGGSDDDDNLQTLCGTCNSRKGAR